MEYYLLLLAEKWQHIFLFYVSLPPRTKKRRLSGWHHLPHWNRFWKQAFPELALWKVKSCWSTIWHRMRVPLRRYGAMTKMKISWATYKTNTSMTRGLSTLRWHWTSCWTCRTCATLPATHSVTTRQSSSTRWCRWKTSCWRTCFFGYLFFAMLECFLFWAKLLNINHMHPCISKYLYNTVIHPSYFVYLFQLDGKHVSYQIIYHNLEGVQTKPWPHCKLAAQICSRSRSVRCFGSEATNFETMHHDRFWEHSNPRLWAQKMVEWSCEEKLD